MKRLFWTCAILFAFALRAGGTIIPVPPGSAGLQVQVLLDAAQPGDTLVFTAGQVYTMPNGGLVFNPKIGTGEVRLESSALASLPWGKRVSPADAANMARLVAAPNSPVIKTAAGANHFGLYGLDLTSSGNVDTLVLLGAVLPGQQTMLSQVPYAITMERCWVHAAPGASIPHGISIHSAETTIQDCYVGGDPDTGDGGFWSNGQDAQAGFVVNTPGHLRFLNSFWQGSGENFMVGGAPSSIPGVVPSDIEFRRNTFSKPKIWFTTSKVCKNLVELKTGCRVLFDGNTLQNSGTAAQSGNGIVITPRNINGSNPQNTCQDIWITGNTISDVGIGVYILGGGQPYPSGTTSRVTIENNRFLRVTAANGGNGTLAGTWVCVGSMPGYIPDHITLDHNTVDGLSGAALYCIGPPTAKLSNLTCTNNIFSYNGAGAISGDGGPALVWNNHLPSTNNNLITANAIICPTPNTSYPAGNYWPVDASAVGWIDQSGGDYELGLNSPYRTCGLDGCRLGYLNPFSL